MNMPVQRPTPWPSFPGFFPNPQRPPTGETERPLPKSYDPGRFAWLTEGSSLVPAWVGGVPAPFKFMDEPAGLRNYLALSYIPQVTNGTILIGFGRAPVPNGTMFRAIPGAIYVWDQTIPQNDLWVCMSANTDPAGVLGWQFSTFTPRG